MLPHFYLCKESSSWRPLHLAQPGWQTFSFPHPFCFFLGVFWDGDGQTQAKQFCLWKDPQKEITLHRKAALPVRQTSHDKQVLTRGLHNGNRFSRSYRGLKIWRIYGGKSTLTYNTLCISKFVPFLINQCWLRLITFLYNEKQKLQSIQTSAIWKILSANMAVVCGSSEEDALSRMLRHPGTVQGN